MFVVVLLFVHTCLSEVCVVSPYPEPIACNFIEAEGPLPLAESANCVAANTNGPFLRPLSAPNTTDAAISIAYPFGSSRSLLTCVLQAVGLDGERCYRTIRSALCSSHCTPCTGEGTPPPSLCPSVCANIIQECPSVVLACPSWDVALQQACSFEGQPCTKAIPFIGTYLPMGVGTSRQTLDLSPSFLLSWVNDTSDNPSLADRRAAQQRFVIFSPGEEDEVRWTIVKSSVDRAAGWTAASLDALLASRTSDASVLSPIYVAGDTDLKGSLRLTLDSDAIEVGQVLQVPLVESTGDVTGDLDAIRVVLRNPLLSSRSVTRVVPTAVAMSSVVVVRVRVVPATIVLDDANPTINSTDLLDADRTVSLELDPTSDTPIEFAGDADLSNSSLSIDLAGGKGDGGAGEGGTGEGQGDGNSSSSSSSPTPPPTPPTATKTKTIEISGDANLAGARLVLAVPRGTDVGTVVLELRVAGNLTSSFDQVSLDPGSSLPDPTLPCNRFALEQRMESPNVVQFVYVADPVATTECLFNATLCSCLTYDPLAASGTGSIHATGGSALTLGLAVGVSVALRR